MTIAKPISKTLIVGLLIAVALVVYVAMSTRVGPAPSLPSFTLNQQTQTETRGTSPRGNDQAAPPSQSSQSSTVENPSGSSGSTSGAGTSRGIQRFADGGPDVVAPAAAQKVQSCGPKPCPRPQ